MTLAALLDQLAPDAIERACAGDRAAIEELVSIMQRPFHNLALRMLGDRSLAEDAAQECLLRVITHLSEFRGEARFATWATRIAVNATLDFRSGLARNVRHGFDEFAWFLAQGLDDQAPDRPEDALLVKQAKTLCNRALLQCLDGDHRVAFVLGEILEFEAGDAAAILGLEPATYRKRLSRARAALTETLGQTCSVHTPGLRCACHRKVGDAIRRGRIAPEELEVRLGDLAQLRTRLGALGSGARTLEMYRADELPDLRREVLASVRAALLPLTG
jgi:RNA polymerase sigma factor (sigma-70 family)